MIKIFDGYTLISDFDGTIFSHKNMEIPKVNLKALERFRALGGQFILATGRSVESARRYAGMVGANLPCVLYNGAALYDYEAETFIYKETINRDEVLSFFEELKEKFPDVGMEIAAPGQHFMITRTEYSEEHAGNEILGYIDTNLAGTAPQWLKALTSGMPDDIENVHQYALANLPQCLRVTKSSDYFCEFIAKDCNKFAAAKRLMVMLNLHPRKTCGIGDYYNDLELFRDSWAGAVPSGAPEGVRALAPHTVCSCEDGALAEFIEYIEQKIIKGDI